jgi:hypothetical protein
LRQPRAAAVLRNWRADLPVDPDASTAKLLKRPHEVQRKADRGLAVALSDGDDSLLHRARKAAKRSRYAAELCKDVGARASCSRVAKLIANNTRRMARWPARLSATPRTKTAVALTSWATSKRRKTPPGWCC